METHQNTSKHTEILTVDEVSEMFKISKETVKDWARNGDVPAKKVGKFWYFHKEDVEKFIKS